MFARSTLALVPLLVAAVEPRAQGTDVPLVPYVDNAFPAGLQLGLSAGASVGDYDGDGWVDIYVNTSGNLWRNLEGQGWELATNLNGGGLISQYGASFGDYDNDGLPDLITEPRRNCMRLFHNLGNGTFADIAADPSLLDVQPCNESSETACWGDVDFDGNLDLFLPTYPPTVSGGTQDNYFWHNLGPTGPGNAYRFTETSRAVGLPIPAGNNRPEGAQFCDYDGDGDLDLYSNGALYQNRSTLGAPLFEAMDPASSGIGLNTVLDEGAAFFDYDLDGDQDLCVVYADSPGVTLWENRGDGTFIQAESTIIETPLAGTDFGMSTADWDNDGDLDLQTRFVFRRNQLIETGQRSFTVATHGVPFLDLFFPSLAWADFDRDGDLDCAIGNFNLSGGTGNLFVNTTCDEPQSKANPVVRLRPVRDAMAVAAGLETEFGAFAQVLVPGLPHVRRQFTASGHGYLNQSEYALHFALPRAEPTPPEPTAALRLLGAKPIPATTRWAMRLTPLTKRKGRMAAEVLVDFPGDPAAGSWRVDRHVNPVLGDLDPGALSNPELSVFRSGKVHLDGCVVSPAPLESPRLYYSAGGLALPQPATPLPPPNATPPETFVGIELRVLTQPVRLVEVVLDGELAAQTPFNVALWNVTDGQQPVLERSWTQATSPRNDRTRWSVDCVLLPTLRYRLVAAVTRERATLFQGPSEVGGLVTEGGLTFVDPDPTSGTAMAAALLDATAIRLAVGYRPTVVGVPVDLDNALPGGANAARLTISGSFLPMTGFQLLARGGRPLAPAVLVMGSGLQCVDVGGVKLLAPAPAFELPGPREFDATGQLYLPGIWPAGVPEGSRLAFQVWYLDPTASTELAATNLLFLTTP